MTALQIRFTYDITTEESAAEGDISESGWYIPHLGYFPIEDDTASEYTEVRAKEAVKLIREIVGSIDSISEHTPHRVNIYPADATPNFQNGGDTRHYAHLYGNPRLLRAICKVLRA